MDAEMAREINEIGRKFKTLIASLDDRTLKDVLIYSAQPMEEKIAQKAPRSRRTHYRYDTPKLVRKLRAPNGRGVRVATYGPGNLSRSIRTLSFRRMKRSVLVGPKLSKKSTGKFTSQSRVDGYYANFVETGTKEQSAQNFIRQSAATTRVAVLSRMNKSFQRLLDRKIALLNLR